LEPPKIHDITAPHSLVTQTKSSQATRHDARRSSCPFEKTQRGKLHNPALFETNEEFTLRPGALGKIHPSCRDQVKDYLTKLSELKYAPSYTEETDNLIDEADELLALIEVNIGPAKV